MYNKPYNIQKFFFLYLILSIAFPAYSMLRLELMDLQSTPYEFTRDRVAAYTLDKHISALSKSSSYNKSVVVFPKIYYEQKNDNNTLIFVNYVLEVLQALPQEQSFRIREENKAVYDCRQLCEILKSNCSICHSCIEKKDKKKQNRNKVTSASSSPTVSNNQAFIILGAYGLICFSLGGSLGYLYSHFFRH